MSDASLIRSIQDAASALLSWQEEVNRFMIAAGVTFSAAEMDKAREQAHCALDAYLDAIASTNAEIRRAQAKQCR